MSLIIAILVGFTMPAQTGVNTRLRQRVGTPIGASFISFTVGALFLMVATLILEHDLDLFTDTTLAGPFWIWLGGCLGAIIVTGNIPLMSALGSVQTAIFPVAGQIVMGLVIDHFGLFRANRIPVSAFRILGAAIVFVGLIIVTLSRNSDAAGSRSGSPASKSAAPARTYSPASLWLYRLAGIGIGMLSACQAAVNGCLGRLLDSSLKGSFVSFTVGMIALAVINLVMRNRINIKGDPAVKDPWWIWTGGIFGGTCVLGTVYFVKILGVGLTALATTGGTTIGGVLVDKFGLFGAQKKRISALTIIGLVIMIAGAAMVRLL